MTPEVRKSIFEIIRNNLPDAFRKNVFWAQERQEEPDNPYCLLQAVIPEQKTAKTAEREIENNIIEVTMFKNAVVTVSVFVRGALNNAENDLDALNRYAQETARKLKNYFETVDSSVELYSAGMSCSVISGLRDLTTPVEGGYNYRYEFDLTFGYDEIVQIQKPVGRSVILNIERKT